MRRVFRDALLVLALCGVVAPAPAATLTVGQSDTFEDGTTQGWSDGPANPTPAFVVAGGGPGGAGDAYLVITSSGLFGAGGKLVGMAGASWGGDYPLARVTSILMDVNNLGSTDLSLRLLFEGATGGDAISGTPVLVPAGSGWRRVSFSALPGALVGSSPGASLSSVTRLRLYHGSGAFFPGEDIAAQLGIDNVTAVPEPATWLMLLSGLAMTLAAVSTRRLQAT